jgi:hypothetical protein
MIIMNVGERIRVRKELGDRHTLMDIDAYLACQIPSKELILYIGSLIKSNQIKSHPITSYCVTYWLDH